jgi:predicted esterase
MIESASIPVERSFRYAVRKAEKQTDVLVYILHGYGQLAGYFIRKVADVLPETVTIVAPEGMHRFYLNGTSGRVGASWMTKEARELDIRENTEMLDKLHERLSAEYQPQKVVVIGFSQGGATAARLIANGAVTVDAFVSWASVFPPDLSFPTETIAAKAQKLDFVLGTQDPYFDGEAAGKACEAYKQLGFGILRFEGGHDLDPVMVQQLIEQL